jgi:hypothetical protein
MEQAVDRLRSDTLAERHGVALLRLRMELFCPKCHRQWSVTFRDIDDDKIVSGRWMACAVCGPYVPIVGGESGK